MTKLPTVKKQFRNLHPEVDRVYVSLEGLRLDKYGFLRYGNKRLSCTNLRVTSDQLGRMALFLDVLFRIAEQLGDNSGVERSRDGELSLRVLGERFSFELWQGLKKTPHTLTPKEIATQKRQLSWTVDKDISSALSHVPEVDYLPTTLFTLQLQPLWLNDSCVRRTWKDTPDRPLELQLDRMRL